MKPCLTGIGPVVPLILTFWLVATTAQAGATVGAGSVVDIAFEAVAPYYEPQEAVVPTGTPVRWVNSTASPHSVRHDGCLREESCAFQSLAVPPDSSYAIAPLPPGRYPYHCELHPIMRGTLIVVEPAARHEEGGPQSDFTR